MQYKASGITAPSNYTPSVLAPATAWPYICDKKFTMLKILYAKWEIALWLLQDVAHSRHPMF